MSHIRIDKSKAIKKWSPVLENMGVTGERVEWMAEYAEFHSINENAYVNASNVSGMGGVIAAQPSTLAGQTIGNSTALGGYGPGSLAGSGDVGQNLLPVAMKIAAQTIGLDLVAVKPSPGPKIDLLYIDFRYDDVRNGDSDERPQVFKLNAGSATSSVLATAITTYCSTLAGAPVFVQSSGGLQSGRYFLGINSNADAAYAGTVSTVFPETDKEGVVEFLGFSRIDGFPIFRAFRQANTAHTAVGSVGNTGVLWSFDKLRNTFNPTASMISQINSVAGVTINSGFASIELVSALEDHIPGFSANWNQGGTGFTGNYPMDRQMDDDTYAGVIGPKISSKTVAVGTIEVSSALRRTEIEDIKANTGMDIVQKMESILVNELSQTISKQIVAKIFELGDLNRTSAPLRTGVSIFDLNTNYATGSGAIGGETTHAVQRKLVTKIAHASNYIATEGRVGPAQYLITNGGLAAALSDISGYTINPVKSKMNAQGQLYPVGSIGDISIYVDPYMRYNDNRIVLGRKNNPDQPGIIFVPYLMAQSISIISEATFAPRMLLRSRYAVTEVGWYPQKQFMTIKVTDDAGLLN